MNVNEDRLHQGLRALDREVEVTEEDIAHAQHRFMYRREQRVHLRRSVTTLAAAIAAIAAIAAVALGSVVLSQSLNDPSVDPANPDRGGAEIVVHSFGGDHAERPPSELPPLTEAGMAPYPVWQAFDQDSGRFLFAGDGGGAVWVFAPGHDTPVATIGCDTQCYWPTFGPGPDEVTVLEADGVGWPPHTAHVYGFDGALRDTTDISGALGNVGIEDIAWSPDGSQLAVSTLTGAREPDCHKIECDARVWLFDRAGGDPVPIYQQSVPVQTEANPPLLSDLAWSPDGEQLGLVSSTYYPERADRPTLVTIAVDSRRSDTIYTFNDCGTCNPSRYGFAWSPDGTRIAVTNGADIAQLSADGTTTFESLGNGSGPLAWLDEPPQ